MQQTQFINGELWGELDDRGDHPRRLDRTRGRGLVRGPAARCATADRSAPPRSRPGLRGRRGQLRHLPGAPGRRRPADAAMVFTLTGTDALPERRLRGAARPASASARSPSPPPAPTNYDPERRPLGRLLVGGASTRSAPRCGWPTEYIPPPSSQTPPRAQLGHAGVEGDALLRRPAAPAGTSERARSASDDHAERVGDQDRVGEPLARGRVVAGPAAREQHLRPRELRCARSTAGRPSGRASPARRRSAPLGQLPLAERAPPACPSSRDARAVAGRRPPDDHVAARVGLEQRVELARPLARRPAPPQTSASSVIAISQLASRGSAAKPPLGGRLELRARLVRAGPARRSSSASAPRHAGIAG